jgi:hypothetical protein
MRTVRRMEVAASLIGLGLLSAGCTYHDQIGHQGSFTFEMPGMAPPGMGAPGSPAPTQPVAGGMIGPPPGLAGVSEVVKPGSPPPSGAYAGIARNILDPSGLCADPLHIHGFMVNGNQVTFAQWSGTIQPSGGLTMQWRDAWIYGQFLGSHFEGRFWQPQPACTYAVSLEPVGG